MMEDELIRVWKSSPQKVQVKFDKSRFMLDVQSNIDAFYKQSKLLYIREAMGAFIAIPMFTGYAFLMPNLLSKIGFLLVALGAVFILYVLWRSKRSIPDQFSLNYLRYLEETKVFLETSKRHRETVVLWYLLPIVAPLWLAMLGLYLDDPDTLNYTLITTGGSILAGVVIHLLNKRSAQKVVAPKLDKVNSLLKAMKE